jgi:hypothetical protein
MLAADAELESGRAPRPRSAPSHQLADALAVERDERIVLEDALGDVGAEEAGRVVARDAEVVCVRSLVPKEKNSADSRSRRPCSAARGSSIIVPTR